MRRHPEALRSAGISVERYRELRAICRQYQEYRRRAARQRAGLVDRSGGEAWHWDDPTGEAAVWLAWLPEARRIRMIEDCVDEVADAAALRRALLASVTEGSTYEVLRPPCGSKQFYALRLRFFIALHRRMWREQ